MRMWMCDTSVLCKKHLLGEHFELHKHKHNFVKGHSIEGRRGQIEPISMKKRHDELAREMSIRGYNHKSEYEQPDLSKYNLIGFTVDVAASTKDLQERCQECLKRGNHEN